MFIENTFLQVKFTEITLLHILILLGFPYLIFYIFEKIVQFEKFVEKWEAGLFVFTFGGFITLLSLIFQKYFYSFILGYLFFMSLFILIGIFLIFKYIKPKNSFLKYLFKELKGQRIHLILKDKTIIKGNLKGISDEFTLLYQKVGESSLYENKKKLPSNHIFIKTKEIDKILYNKD